MAPATGNTAAARFALFAYPGLTVVDEPVCSIKLHN